MKSTSRTTKGGTSDCQRNVAGGSGGYDLYGAPDSDWCEPGIQRGETADDHSRREAMILGTLCGTLWLATLGILVLMGMRINVAKEVSIAIAAQWGGLLAVAYRMHSDRSARREL